MEWEGVTITVVKPDGTSQKLGPFKTDSTDSTYTTFIPDQPGVYNLTTNFPNQSFLITYTDSERCQRIEAGTILLASTASSKLIVHEEPSLQFPGHALPSEYWSRPIDPQLREWFSVSGNWVARPDNSLALYNDDAPESAHVLWTEPHTPGGLVGGLFGDVPAAMYAGDVYEGKFSNSVIINGVLYYNTGATNEAKNGVVAVWDKELRKHYGSSVETGDYLWETESEIYLDMYGWGNAEHTWYFAYGKLYSVGVGGILYAYGDQTGKTA